MSKSDTAMTRWAEAQLTVGQILQSEARRDAIHFAVAPCVAAEALKPGTHISVDGRAKPSGDDAAVGIVDPFLTRAVLSGERFWLFLYPNTITTLRHVWEHPAFAQESQPFVPAGASAEERRLREIADAIGCDYFDMMAGADTWVETSKDSKWGGEYLTQHGSEGWRDDFPAYVDEFWRLYDVVRRTNVPAEHRESFFFCSC